MRILRQVVRILRQVVRVLRGRGGGVGGELGVGNVDVRVMQEEPFSSNVLILTAIHPLQVGVKTSANREYESARGLKYICEQFRFSVHQTMNSQ